LAQENPKALLVILDGFGLAEDPSVSAIAKADTPFIDSLLQNEPNSRLSASGEDVGLPEGQFGNSEVGHLNIGAGRIVWQELSRVNKDIREGTFYENDVLLRAFDKASETGKIHLMGLFSDGGVHSHNTHLYALLEMAKKSGLDHAFVHAFTDGRDTSPHGGIDYCKEFEKTASETGIGEIASVVGRYYAMDRDNRWERTERAYRLLVHGDGEKVTSATDAFENSYAENVTDEFILPHIVQTDKNSRINDGDVVIYFNIRGDRTRQLTKALLQFDEVPFKTESLDLNYFTFTSYDDTFSEHVSVIYPPVDLKNTLGSYLSRHSLRQLRIAETEKYPHVTYFFNGGVETPDEGEERILVPSPKVATYDLKPEMSATEVTVKLCEQIEKETFDFGVINYANPDMVGHTGVMEAAVKAVETVDSELKKVVEAARRHNYNVLIISDHGNADIMTQPDGSSHTAHTTSPVPAILIGIQNARMNDGKLADVAPTILKIMKLPQPEEMTGKPLF
jgi:2,3-bisphosphoglycerate-independent phosphoglycerate mutase